MAVVVFWEVRREPASDVSVEGAFWRLGSVACVLGSCMGIVRYFSTNDLVPMVPTATAVISQAVRKMLSILLMASSKDDERFVRCDDYECEVARNSGKGLFDCVDVSIF